MTYEGLRTNDHGEWVLDYKHVNQRGQVECTWTTVNPERLQQHLDDVMKQAEQIRKCAEEKGWNIACTGQPDSWLVYTDVK